MNYEKRHIIFQTPVANALERDRSISYPSLTVLQLFFPDTVHRQDHVEVGTVKRPKRGPCQLVTASDSDSEESQPPDSGARLQTV